ncbi:WXG100 family type VII secretion target [Nocardia sp. IBHARD005]|uniref:WXG100 family type VII secretion target n=1 Tax=Nocardia sp. IBHARD005 TaxID=3457765 RepID=UPI00405A0416
MSDNSLLMDGAAITAATNSLTGINQSLEAGLRSVISDIEQLLQGGWSGEAADGFRTLYQEGRATFEQLMTEASSIIAAVPTVVDTLTNSDNSHAGDLRAVQSSLDL